MRTTQTPQNWKNRRFGELFKVKHGYAFKGRYFADSGPYIVLTPGNFFEEGGFRLKSKEKYYVGEFPSGYVLKRGDLLVAMTEQAEGLLGSSALIPEGGPFLHNQRLGLITDLNGPEIDKNFLYHLFNTRGVRAQIQATASGTKVRHTSPSRIYEVEVNLPPLSTQRKIAAILSAYDDLITNNTRRIAILEQMAQLLYREWFVHFRFPGHESARMVDSVLGPIPEGWQVGAFSDLAVIKRDNVKPDESEDEIFEYYSFPAFDSNRMPAFERGAEIRSNKYLVHRGSVLLSKLNPHIPRVWLPFLDTEHCAVASTEFLILLPKEPFTCEYLFSLCNSQDFLQRFAGLATGTSTSHQRVKPGSLQNMQVPLPSRDLVQEFGSLATPVFRAIYTLQTKNTVLHRTRDLLLPRLISGELDVSELAIDVGEEDDHG